MELLESRNLLSCVASLSGTVLTVAGDARDNSIEVQYEDGVQADVWCDGEHTVFLGGLTEILLKGKGGDDQLGVWVSDGLVAGSSLLVDVRGQDGDDWITVEAWEAIAGSLTVREFGGSGEDDLELSLDSAIGPASVDVLLNGGGGADWLWIDHVAESPAIVGVVNGGSGDDVLISDVRIKAVGVEDVDI